MEVAIASIIARYAFILQIESLRKKSNIDLPFGSETRRILNTKKQVENKKLNMSEYAKMHFNTIKK